MKHINNGNMIVTFDYGWGYLGLGFEYCRKEKSICFWFMPLAIEFDWSKDEITELP